MKLIFSGLYRRFNFLKGNFSYRNTNKVLCVLLIIDLIFIAVHSYIGILFYSGKIVNLQEYLYVLVTHDQSLPEFFQYVKFLFILVLLAYLLAETKEIGFTFWILLFLVFLLDDAFSFHEQFGVFMQSLFNITTIAGLEGNEIGEIIYALLLGTIMSFILIVIYKKSSLKFKEISFDLILLIGIFLLFGIGVDFLHSLAKNTHAFRSFLGLLEDGGEMLALTFILWYITVIFKFRKESRPLPYLNQVFKNLNS